LTRIWEDKNIFADEYITGIEVGSRDYLLFGGNWGYITLVDCEDLEQTEIKRHQSK